MQGRETYQERGVSTRSLIAVVYMPNGRGSVSGTGLTAMRSIDAGMKTSPQRPMHRHVSSHPRNNTPTMLNDIIPMVCNQSVITDCNLG